MHYAGIVGYRATGTGTEFLYIDPYPGFSTTTYHGEGNDFMGILKYDKASATLTGQSGSRKICGYAGPR